MPRLKLTCECCGINFERWASQRKKRDFCSVKCAAIKRRERGAQAAIERTNKLVQPESYKLIALTRGRCAKVSNEDFEALRSMSWYMDNENYAGGRCSPRMMHRYIFEVLQGKVVPGGKVVDHRNRDTLDNRRSNLRIATPSQNTANSTGQPHTTSKFKRVCWNKERQAWTVHITKNGQQLSLGTYEDEVEAAYIYDQFALALFGEYAHLNVIIA